VAWYEKARQAIRAALVSDKVVGERLRELAQVIEQMPTRTPYDGDASRVSADGVRRFAKIHEKLSLKGTKALLPSSPSFVLASEGVSISIAPAVILRRTARDGTETWGALVVVFRKGEALGTRGGKAVAELVRLCLANSGYKNIRADLCIAVDVFSGRIFTASGRGTRVAAEIASACREIAVRWPALNAA